jgi:predicted lipoprotein with Yx(FWY)xxD motif
MRTRSSFGLLVVVALCGFIGSVTAVGAAPSARATLKVALNPTVKKQIVVDGSGRTLYMFAEDTHGKPQCQNADPTCPKVWPALTSTGKPIAGKGINPRLITIVKGAGGKPQVRYNRHPLYYFTGDKKPGDATGLGLAGAWFLVSPKGTAIEK